MCRVMKDPQDSQKINVVHLAPVPEERSWFQGLLIHLDQKGFFQSIVSVSNSDVDFEQIFPFQIRKYKSENRIFVIRLLIALILIKKNLKRNYKNVVLAQGHRESTISYIASKLFGLDYILIHHMQPGYFNLFKSKKPVSSFVHKLFHELYAKNAIAVQSLSLDVSHYLEGLGVSKSRIMEIPHGVDFDKIQHQFFASNTFESREFLRVLMVGRLSPEKNYEIAVKSFAQFLDHFPNALLTIAGEGPCRGDITNLINELGISSSVELLGFKSDIISLMRNSDALLHVAATESYGRVYLEALICDLPVFTPKIGITLDLESISRGKIIFLQDSSPDEISKKLVDYFGRNTEQKKSTMPEFRNYRAHDQEEVFKRIAVFLSEVLNK
jgi:glycosyltransferase involved in cell wall biosynthesis